ncbi:hypothetical protein ACQ4M3_00730 [Leptolyngbya sp. AN03gr2]|uniref:hypothetical protein n=1 Tax=unclassified Leptolyngbya TaxID=2650499 RepID=UPI003D3105D7
MNKKLVAALLTSPSLFSSVVLNANAAHAAAVSVQSTTAGSTPIEQRVCSHARCVSSSQLASTQTAPIREVVFEQATIVAAAQPTYSEYPMTIEESNAAIALFGCDCPACVNALRQLRGQAPYL